MALTLLTVVVLASATGAASVEPVNESADVGPEPTSEGGELADVADRNETIPVRYTLERVPDRPAMLEVTMVVATDEFDAEGLEYLDVTFDEHQSVTRTHGFEPSNSTGESTGAQQYTVNTSIDEPAVTYRWNVDASSPSIYGTSWTLVRGYDPVPKSLGWTADWSYTIDETIEIRGPGIRRDRAALISLLGEYERQEHSFDDETIERLVPGDVEPLESPDATFQALEYSSRTLAVDDGPSNLTLVVTPQLPTAQFLVGGKGLASGDVLFLLDSSEVSTAIHEYVHSQQTFETDDRMEWLVEGSARYYGRQLAVEQGFADRGEFEHLVHAAAFDDSVLANESTWHETSNYHKGGSLVALLDRDIRLESEGERTFADVFRALNDYDDPITVEDFLAEVRAVGGDDVAATAERYVTTDALVPDEWEPGLYEAAYGFEPPDFRSSYVASEVLVSNENRPVRLDDDVGPITVGESVTFGLVVTNEGGIDGRYSIDTAVVRDGDTGVDTEMRRNTGWVSPGESTEDEVALEFDEPGVYDVVIDHTPITSIHVVEDETDFSIIDAEPGARSFTADQPVTVDAAISNDRDTDETVTLDLLVDGTVASNTTVAVEAGATETVSFTLEPLPEGDHDLQLEGWVDDTLVTTASAGSVEVTDGARLSMPEATLTADVVTSGDPIAVDLSLTNEGTTAGVAQLDLIADGPDASVEPRNVTVEPGETRPVTIAQNASTPGTYDVYVQATTLDRSNIDFVDLGSVAVTDGPAIDVTEAEPIDEARTTDDALGVTATVANEGNEADAVDVGFLVDGAVVATRTVTVEPGTTERLTLEHDVDAAMDYDLSIDVTGTSFEESIDVGTVAVSLGTIAGNQPRDLDGDGRYEDLDGDGEFTAADVEVLFTHLEDPVVQANPSAFDRNANGRVDFGDVVALHDQL